MAKPSSKSYENNFNITFIFPYSVFLIINMIILCFLNTGDGNIFRFRIELFIIFPEIIVFI